MNRQNHLQIVVLLGLGLLISCTQNGNTQSSYSDINEWISIAKSEIKTIDNKGLTDFQENGEPFVLIDVRTRDEHDSGYIPGSVLIPRGLIEFRIAKIEFWEDEGLYEPLKDDVIILYCRSGNRSALAVESLKKLGYKNVISLEGGYNQWKEIYPDDIEINLPKFDPGSKGPIVVEDEVGSC